MPLKWTASQDFEQGSGKIYLRFFGFFPPSFFSPRFKRISQDVLLRIDCRGPKVEGTLIRMVDLPMVVAMVK